MIKVSVYINNGNVYEYEVRDYIAGREHASAIIDSGYRHSEGGDLVWYPPHKILKVKVESGAELSAYKDSPRAT